MNLWILKAKVPFTGYARIQNMVVRAETEQRARDVAAREEQWAEDCVWKSQDDSTCDLLTADGDEGVIIVDNNGG